MRPKRPRKSSRWQCNPKFPGHIPKRQTGLYSKLHHAPQDVFHGPLEWEPHFTGGAEQTPSSGILIDLPEVTQPQVKKAESLGWLTAKKGFFPPNHNSFGMKKSFSALYKQQRHQRCF